MIKWLILPLIITLIHINTAYAQTITIIGGNGGYPLRHNNTQFAALWDHTPVRFGNFTLQIKIPEEAYNKITVTLNTSGNNRIITLFNNPRNKLSGIYYHIVCFPGDFNLKWHNLTNKNSKVSVSYVINGKSSESNLFYRKATPRYPFLSPTLQH